MSLRLTASAPVLFFFQAEDGIRDIGVTGVQTCALPISAPRLPTPLTGNREPDLGPLLDSGHALAGILQAGQLVVLESTTYPGTTRERLLPVLEESGLAAGRDFNLAFSPERVDPGRTDYTLRTTPKIFGGLTEECGDRTHELYSRVCDNLVRVSSPDVAEMAKLLENIFRSVNIALVNE